LEAFKTFLKQKPS